MFLIHFGVTCSEFYVYRDRAPAEYKQERMRKRKDRVCFFVSVTRYCYNKINKKLTTHCIIKKNNNIDNNNNRVWVMYEQYKKPISLFFLFLYHTFDWALLSYDIVCNVV